MNSCNLMLDGDGKPLHVLDNFKKLLDFHHCTAQFNVITKAYEFADCTSGKEVKLGVINSWFNEIGFRREDRLPLLRTVCEANRYNPVMEWVESEPWNGEDHITALCETITSRQEAAKNLVLRKWLIAALYLAMGRRATKPGCLVLYGNASCERANWIKALCPLPGMIQGDFRLRLKDAKQVTRAVSCWIADIGEAGDRMRKSTTARLLDFISCPLDSLTGEMGLRTRIHARRTALALCADKRLAFEDNSGQRRFWPVTCEQVKADHGINVQQIWAQVLHLIAQGATPDLSTRDAHVVDKVNKSLKTTAIEKLIMEKYDWRGNVRQWKNASQVAREIGVDNLGKSAHWQVAAALRKLECLEKNLDTPHFFAPALQN